MYTAHYNRQTSYVNNYVYCLFIRKNCRMLCSVWSVTDS